MLATIPVAGLAAVYTVVPILRKSEARDPLVARLLRAQVPTV
jgi:hypothetical protein